MSEKLLPLPFSTVFPTFFLGPPLEEGPLPALFYFALSAEESLTLSPFDQPISFLRNRKMRLFSITLPGHGPGIDPNKGIGKWKESALSGGNPITPWIEDARTTLLLLIEKNLVQKNEIALAGLSRGAFCALHLASTLDFSLPLACYAPLLDLRVTDEFASFDEGFSALDLLDKLSLHRFFFSIGNRDVRVGTHRTLSLVTALAEKMFLEGKRSPPVELHVTPSIGFKGHGTSREIFELGAAWAAREIGVSLEQTV